MLPRICRALTVPSLLAAVAVAAAPPVAQAGRRPRVEVSIPFDNGDYCPPPVAVEQQVWVEPVYRTACDRQWVPAVTRTVCTPTWVPPVTQSVRRQVYAPAVYEWRTVIVRDGWGQRSPVQQQVMVCPARYEDRCEAVEIAPGHYEDVQQQQVVCDGHWQTVERQELVAPGHWESRTVAVRQPPPRGEVRIRLPF